MFPKILIYSLIFLVLWMIYSEQHEGFGSGALTQLYARGPEDRYQIGSDAFKGWWPYYYPYPYVESVWHNPTRLQTYPLYGIYPYPYYYFSPYYYPATY